MVARIIIPIIVALLGIYAISVVLTSGTNALSEAMIYLSIVGFMVGVLNSKAGMIFLVLCGSYLDLVKRFLVVGGSLNMMDVMKTLAVAPVCVCGIYIGLTAKYFLQKEKDMDFPWSRIGLAFVAAMLVIATSLTGGVEMSKLLQSAANSALYVGLMGFASIIYRDSKEQHRFFYMAALIFVPVVLYAWAQLIFGYNQIEEDYARSGLSVITNPLLHPSEIEYKRVFSTMNSSPAYVYVGAIFSVYALFFGLGTGKAKHVLGGAFALACLATHIPGAMRTGWLVVIIMIAGSFLFRYKLATILTYTGSLAFAVIFLLRAEEIGIWLADEAAVFASSDFAERATTMGTFTTRTQGIAEWFGNPIYFSYFGLSAEEVRASGVHDMIGYAYMSTGIVGLVFMAVIGTSMLVYLHSKIIKIRDSADKALAAFYISCVFSLILSGIFSGSQLHVFPLNAYFWLILGFLFQIILSNRKLAA